jgi:hypothetical protein
MKEKYVVHGLLPIGVKFIEIDKIIEAFSLKQARFLAYKEYLIKYDTPIKDRPALWKAWQKIRVFKKTKELNDSI